MRAAARLDVRNLGRGASLSTRQKFSALEGLRAAGIDMRRRIPAVMTSTLDDAAAMLAGLNALGCSAALVLPRSTTAPTRRASPLDSTRWWRARGAARIDLLLYNIPRLSGVRFTSALVQTILDRHGSRIVRIKDSTGDLDSGLTLARAFPALSVFTDDDRILPGPARRRRRRDDRRHLVGLGEVLRRVPTPSRLIADRSYDARKLRDWLAERGCQVVIPPNPTRKNPCPWDPTLYRARNVIERMFCRLKDF